MEDLGVPPLGQVDVLVVVGGDAREGAARRAGRGTWAPRPRSAQALLGRAGPDLHQALGLRIGERAQHDRVEQAEDRRVGADAQPQGEDRDQREAGALAQVGGGRI